MKKWEYRSSYNDPTCHKLNEFGDEGWEMCGSSDVYLYFKREKVEEWDLGVLADGLPFIPRCPEPTKMYAG